MEFNGKHIERDAQGYLMNHTDWCEELVPMLAAEENIELTEAHWEVVRFVRSFYEEFKTSPAVRMLVKAMEKEHGPEKGNSKYLFRLFKLGPAKQATKLAGLPKPAKCL
ncbi:TusE/DsrC/DsvC family sulfur relay protein [Aliivibrio sp. S4TY2]|uniref:TusE/DsrC/DsvC family sulfur relay protein n=1 Tax=unclassified Aliivibrio TaxID=2645654 RepID=UPI002378413F|nr:MULTISPECIES: TusE/DsrC/DsvC family sulfur relay protein [unclassified Aliivibrio]MDD9155550.1 TusE/DsrC/DsvC family sulfur relay protein [Aliivibrio sp. S4TY2]MDD9160417.1 TusE/DsrC/DsvC family sulfur relay protein [Aliivibrio sp. S4TY1]MDD9164685.1 TusE/DsrC/DsvC family sulfur relay protein [Aliivibrio sp. S4MY2]MDD9168491.1 TusE/DsrC/DsvC family sulfur relay protein [Aliivibrio sp. S4MY4]MDD9185019.1 TusE/DsrC/DsvC family sulfur relay protein [Aliivibrio sp. S4MY3]